MAASFRIPIAVMFFAVVSAVVTEAQTLVANDCSTVVLSMADCLSFVAIGSTAKKPVGGCCAGLKNVVEINAQCLCEGFKNSGKMGIQLDMEKVSALPGVCHVTAPSLSDCGITVPAGPGAGSVPVVPAVSPATPVTVTNSTGGKHEGEAEAAPATPSSGSSALATSVVLTAFAAVLSALF